MSFLSVTQPDLYTSGGLEGLSTIEQGMMKMITPLSGLVYFQMALRKKIAELTDWQEPKMEVRPLDLAVNKLLSESYFLPLLVGFLGFTLMLQNVTSSFYFTSSPCSLPVFVSLIVFGSPPATEFR